MLHSAALLTAEQSRQADRAAIASGITADTLMDNAGKAVADLICRQHKPGNALIICGPGNNGGDGRVVGQLLQYRNWKVTVVTIENFSIALLEHCTLIVDALFGTGLSRPIEGTAAKVIDAVNASHLPIVAIDIASGVNADNGEIMGAAIRAADTVTFVRPKPGQLLLPGKVHTGQLHVYDIGISGNDVTPTEFLNSPPLWRKLFPFPTAQSHKYSRGHAVVVGGPSISTGAARLAAMGALRAGSGLVSVACTSESLPIYAAALTAIMTKPVDSLSQLETLIEDKRITASLIGPGCGVNEATREQVLLLLSRKKPCLLDADAINIFKASAKSLFAAIQGPVVMTPHEGEFARLFPIHGLKTQRAREAAKKSAAVIVLKGNDTVIAAPDGRVAINASAPVWLATAGSGDVLAGIITGLMAQGMPVFEAACAGVWLHGEAANHFGSGLIAEDIERMLPLALKELYHG